METVFNTARGATTEPIGIQLWEWNANAPFALVDYYYSARFTWSIGEPDVAELTLPLNEDTVRLLSTDGTVLVVGIYNGMRHMSQPVRAVVEPGAGDDLTITVTTQGGWGLLQNQLVLPHPLSGMDAQVTADGKELPYSVTGPVETVVKNILASGNATLGHPIVPVADAGRGKNVTVTGVMKTSADLISEALAGTGYWLKLVPIHPGSSYKGTTAWYSAFAVDVEPYRERPEMELDVIAGDLDGWQLTEGRATATRVIAGTDMQPSEGGESRKTYARVIGTEGPSWWGKSEKYVDISDAKSTAELEARGRASLAGSAARTSVDATVSPRSVWEFGSDGLTPRQYTLGDICTIHMGAAGTIQKAITSVEVVATPTELTVTPTLSTPDVGRAGAYQQLITSLRR